MIRVSFEAPSKAALTALLNDYLEDAPPAPAIATDQGGTNVTGPVTPAAAPATRGRGRPAKNTEAPAAKNPPSQGEPVPAAAAKTPEQPSPAAPAAAAPLTKQDVIDALQAMVAATGAAPGTPEAGAAAKEHVSPLLTKHGSSNITGLDASKYAAVIADAKAKAEEITAARANPLA